MARLPAPGEVVDEKYLIESQLGQGGMGVVFAGCNLAGEFPVAIKWLLPEHANNATSVARFRREAQMAAYIRSRNVVQIYDVGVELPYFVMERLRGSSLRDVVMQYGGDGVPLAEVAGIYLPVLQGVSAAHRTRTPSGQAVIHRDLKPDNVFLAESADGIVPTVLDFGIARLAEATDSLTVNTANMILGTPQYMAREQFFDQDQIGPWTDIHALGVILYEMVAGRRPFEQSPGQTPWDLVMKVSLGQFEPLVHVRKAYHDPRLARLDAIVSKAMAPEIKDRYQSVSALVEELAPLLEAFANQGPATMATGVTSGLAPAGVAPFVPGGPRVPPGRGAIRDTRWPAAGGSQVGRGPNTLSPVVTTLAEERPPQAEDMWAPDTLPMGMRGRRLTGGLAALLGAAAAIGLLFAIRPWDPVPDEDPQLDISPSASPLGTTPSGDVSPGDRVVGSALGPATSGSEGAPTAPSLTQPGGAAPLPLEGDGWEPAKPTPRPAIAGSGQLAPSLQAPAPQPHGHPRRVSAARTKAARERKRTAERPAEAESRADSAPEPQAEAAPVVVGPRADAPSVGPTVRASPQVEDAPPPEPRPLGKPPQARNHSLDAFNSSRPVRRTDAFSTNRPASEP